MNLGYGAVIEDFIAVVKSGATPFSFASARMISGRPHPNEQVARNNLRVKLGDLVNVHQCLNIQYGKRVHTLPFDDSIEGLSGNIFDVYLKPYFLDGKT